MNIEESYKEKRNKEFVSKVNDLISKRKAKDYAEIVSKLDWTTSGMSNVINNRRNVPEDIYHKLHKVYSLKTEAPVIEESEETNITILIQNNSKLSEAHLIHAKTIQELVSIIANSRQPYAVQPSGKSIDEQAFEVLPLGRKQKAGKQQDSVK